MPRGKYVNHKGRNRHFTSPEELEAQRKREEEEKWRKARESKEDGDDDDDADDEDNEADEDEDDSESEEQKPKGAASVIEVHNLNRNVAAHKKVEKIETSNKPPQLSRSERAQLEEQRVQANSQAKADLARLAIIKQHRAEAAARREAEKKEKEAKGRSSDS